MLPLPSSSGSSLRVEFTPQPAPATGALAKRLVLPSARASMLPLECRMSLRELYTGGAVGREEGEKVGARLSEEGREDLLLGCEGGAEALGGADLLLVSEGEAEAVAIAEAVRMSVRLLLEGKAELLLESEGGAEALMEALAEAVEAGETVADSEVTCSPLLLPRGAAGGSSSSCRPCAPPCLYLTKLHSCAPLASRATRSPVCTRHSLAALGTGTCISRAPCCPVS